MTAPAPTRGRRSRGRVWLGLVVSGALLWWTVHDVSVREVLASLGAARWLPFAGAVALAVAAQVLRAVRWQVNLRPGGRILAFAPLFYATSIGTLANNLLPARAGEILRSYAARSLTGTPFLTGLVSLAVERVMDGIAIVILCGLALMAADMDTGGTVAGVSVVQLTGTAAVIFGAAFAGTLGVIVFRRHMSAAANAILPRRLPGAARERIEGMLARLVEGLEAVGSPTRTFGILLWSLVIWTLNAAAVWLGLTAFSISVSWAAAFIVQTVIALGVALPSSPGFFGPFEAASRVSLALFGVDASRAVAFALPFHVGVYFIPVLILGVWSLAKTDLTLAGLARDRPPADRVGSACEGEPNMLERSKEHQALEATDA